METRETDKERDERITNEVIIAAYGPEEQALGWYYCLNREMHFPRQARCITARTASPLREDHVSRLRVVSLRSAIPVV
jgi:hypothetical protein